MIRNGHSMTDSGHTDPNQGFGGGGAGDFGGGFGGFEDIFIRSSEAAEAVAEDAIRTPKGRSRSAVHMTLSFEEAVSEKTRKSRFRGKKNVIPAMVQGRSRDESGNLFPLSRFGQLNVEQNTPFGRIVNRRVCLHCNGTGKQIKDKCRTCGGDGKVQNARKISVKIPAGIDDGQQLRQ